MESGRRPPISILIAVAVRLYRDGLAATLGAHERLRVAAASSTGDETQLSVQTTQPDVVIVDVAFDDACGVMRAIHDHSPRSRILAFAVREEITAILEYAAAGADGFVTANSSVADLVEAIERTAAGELLCSPQIAAQLLRRAAHDRAVSEPVNNRATLTGREQQVLSLMRQGRSNKEIATELSIATATAKNHVHHILEKLQVTTRSQAMALGTSRAKAALQARPSSRPAI